MYSIIMTIEAAKKFFFCRFPKDGDIRYRVYGLPDILGRISSMRPYICPNIRYLIGHLSGIRPDIHSI